MDERNVSAPEPHGGAVRRPQWMVGGRDGSQARGSWGWGGLPVLLLGAVIGSGAAVLMQTDEAVNGQTGGEEGGVACCCGGGRSRGGLA